jgi:hypothetical protein
VKECIYDNKIWKGVTEWLSFELATKGLRICHAFRDRKRLERMVRISGLYQTVET